MSWNTNVPNTNQSPGRLPTQAANNWNRLQDIIEANHNFTTSTDTSEGYHTILEWVKQGSVPSAIADAAQTLVADADYKRAGTDVTAPHIFHLPTSGTDSNQFPVSVVPVRAYVVFDGSGSVSANQTINSQYNVDTVYKDSNGNFTINFLNTLPSSKYAVSLSASSSNSTGTTIQIKGGSLATNVTDGLLKIVTDASSPTFVTATIFGG